MPRPKIRRAPSCGRTAAPKCPTAERYARGRATGIEVEHIDGRIETVAAGLVVVSAGAIMSPHLLMHSGIGPRDQLEAFDIECVGDEPGVGQNLSDHPALAVVCEVKDASLIDFDRPIIQTILRYTAPGSDKRNDLQIEQISFAGRPNGPPLFSIAAVLEYQYGRGELRLRSGDPRAAPMIDNRFCEDERDTHRLVACMQDTLNFARTGELADMIKAISFPDPARGDDDESLAALCRKFAGSGYHPSGTVKMGDIQDSSAVVDQFGRAHRFEKSAKRVPGALIITLCYTHLHVREHTHARSARRDSSHAAAAAR